MPIRPENAARYPKDWPEISRRIRFERAGGRCECTGQCGIDHEEEARDFDFELMEPDGERCAAWHGLRHPVTRSKVILTVMHLNHEPEDVSDENLLAGCQRCHLRYDAKHHARNARETIRRRKAVGDLLQRGDDHG